MPAVRVRDALRYASKFVGLLLAVAIVAGGFVGGGAYLARDLNFTDPTLSALSETPVFIGVVLLAIGVILALIGLVALGHKFLADGVAAAAVHETGESAVVEAEDEGETADSDADAGASEAASAGAAATTAGSTAESDSTPDEPSSVDSPAETPPTTEPDDGPVGAPSEAAERDAPAEADEVAGGTIDGHAQSSDPDVDDAPATESGVEDEQPEEPPEWTPPDPSEFEETGSRADDGDGGGVDEATTDEAGAEPDPEEIPDDVTLADEGVDSFSTSFEADPLSDRLPGGDDEN